MFTEGTIVAQASAQGVAARGIIRLSGDSALDVVASFFAPCDVLNDRQTPPSSLEHTARPIVSNLSAPSVARGWFAPWGTEPPLRFVKCALFYWPKGRGFTGERAVELHLPGSQPILDAATRLICSTKRARLATKGEFTLRAFLNGRIDLTQAEAVLGAIEANSDVELRNALEQLSGSLAKDFDRLRENLLNTLGEMEAGFDFVDEDIEFITEDSVKKQIETALDDVETALARSRRQLDSDRSLRVALAGAPNVGKSSLFNSLTQLFSTDARSAALVSDVAGTTRDYLESDLVVDDVRFTLVDAAGIESVESVDPNAPTPRELAQRALERVYSEAALILKCYDSSNVSTVDALDSLTSYDVPTLLVATKCDDPDMKTSGIQTSCATGRGIADLGRLVAMKLRERMEQGEIVPSTAIRCQEALAEARDALKNALALLNGSELRDDFLVASELRLALDAIGTITGKVHTDELLDNIFSRFCIGK